MILFEPASDDNEENERNTPTLWAMQDEPISQFDLCDCGDYRMDHSYLGCLSLMCPCDSFSLADWMGSDR